MLQEHQQMVSPNYLNLLNGTIPGSKILSVDPKLIEDFFVIMFF